MASVLNIATPALLDKVADFIVACQSYEGGIGGEPGNEAHGGNTFCGLAAAMIVGCEHQLDLHSLLVRLARRSRPATRCKTSSDTSCLLRCITAVGAGLPHAVRRRLPRKNQQARRCVLLVLAGTQPLPMMATTTTTTTAIAEV